MTIRPRILISLCLLSACGTADPAVDAGVLPQAGDELLVAKATPSGLRYLEHLPSGYSTTPTGPDDLGYPVMIFLHGSGERGTDLNKLKVAGPPKEIANGHPMTFTVNGKTESLIVLAPQLVSGDWWGNTVSDIVNQALTAYRSDPNRIYLTGLSLGGIGSYGNAAWSLGAKIAAIAPVAGNLQTLSEACVIVTNKVPVWAFHGDSDGTIPLAADQTTINRINACVPAPNPAAMLTIYAGVGHNSWDRAYRPDNSLHNPNLYQWLLMQKRGSVAPPPTNRAPTLATTGATFPMSLTQGATLSFTVNVSDPDGDSVNTDVYLDGRPLLSASGSTLAVIIPTATTTLGTHEIDIVAEDSRGATTPMTLTFTVTAVVPPPSGGVQKLTLSPAMVTNEAGVGNPGNLVDEQSAAGDPAAGQGGTCSTHWDTGWNLATYPAGMVIDLGAEYDLTDLWAWDTNGTGIWKAQTGGPGAWSAPSVIDCSGYLRWVKTPLNTRTRYVRISVPASGTGMNEIVLYGAPAPVAPPTTTERKVVVDFGGSANATVGANNVTDQAGARNGFLAALTDTDAASTALSLAVSGFNNVNSGGTTSPSPTHGLAAASTVDSFYGNTASHDGASAPKGTITLSGLDPSRTYELRFFASRLWVSDNRETLYTVTGAGSASATLDAANNRTERASISAIRPRANGTLTLEVSAGPNNTNGNRFFYLGVLEVLWTE